MTNECMRGGGGGAKRNVPRLLQTQQELICLRLLQVRVTFFLPFPTQSDPLFPLFLVGKKMSTLETSKPNTTKETYQTLRQL